MSAFLIFILEILIFILGGCLILWVIKKFLPIDDGIKYIILLIAALLMIIGAVYYFGGHWHHL